MPFPTSSAAVKKLCTPAYVYFVLSIVSVLFSVFQNWRNNTRYSLGNLSIPVPSITLVFFLKLVSILFWTWMLNLMCKDRHPGIAWFLVLLPFIVYLSVMLGIYSHREGMKTKRNILSTKM